jgi:hypothetical protein
MYTTAALAAAIEADEQPELRLRALPRSSRRLSATLLVRET